MAKKETVNITPDGIKLLTVMCYNGYFDGFYNKEVFFTDGFKGDLQYLFQALGNLGAYARSKDIDKDVEIVIISNQIADNLNADIFSQFTNDFEELLNQNNSPYRRLKFLSEKQLIWYLERRAQNTNDEDITRFIRKYKNSEKENGDNRLF